MTVIHDAGQIDLFATDHLVRETKSPATPDFHPDQVTIFDVIAEAAIEHTQRAEPCVTCAYYGAMSCRETVGTCDLCGKYADVNMDYSKSGDRERPDQTVCLDCLTGGAHITAAHEDSASVAWAASKAKPAGPTPTDLLAVVRDLFDAIWRGETNGFSHEQLVASLAESERTLEDLEAGRITPRRVIGNGYKKPKTVAREYLHRVIADARRDLATEGRTNDVNLANVRFRLCEQYGWDHEAAAHRVTPKTDRVQVTNTLWSLTCMCGDSEYGYTPADVTAWGMEHRRARKIEAHMVGRRVLGRGAGSHVVQ